MPTATTGDRPTAPEPQHPPRTPQDIGYTGSPLGKLTATGVPPWIALLEILLIPLVALAIGFLLNPQDPLWIHSDFHWTWLAPVIVALRYGPLPGLSAAGVLLAVSDTDVPDNLNKSTWAVKQILLVPNAPTFAYWNDARACGRVRLAP